MLKTSTSNVESHHVFSLIVGPSGVGKTSLVKTLPEEETLIISAESGLLSLQGTNYDVWNIESIQDFREAYSELKAGQKYKHVFIDSLTEIAETIFTSLKPNYSKAQNFGLYDEYATLFTAMVKGLRDMTGYHIWCTCLDKLVAVDGIDKISIDLIMKSLSKKLPAFFDEVFYYQIFEKEEKEIRCLLTANGLVDFTKDRSGKLATYEQADLGNILTKIRGEK